MPAVLRLPVAGLVFLAACAGLPPDVDDQTTPTRAYQTFAGSMARNRFRREYECLSPRLQEEFGVRSPADWADARAVALTSRHMLVRGVKRLRVSDERRISRDQAEVDVAYSSLFFSIRGTVTLKRMFVLRIEFADRDARPVLDWLPTREVGTLPGWVTAAVPPQNLQWIKEALSESGEVRSLQVREEWFLDGFRIGSETQKTVGETIQGDS